MQSKAQKELEQKALSLLDDVIKDSESFKHAENRIRIRAAAAYILWRYDEARARVLFREAMASLIDLLKEPMDEDPAEARKMIEGPKQLRTEMLQMLVQRDARLARELLRATRSPASAAGDSKDGTEYYDRQMDLNLATQIASSDPKLAAEIAQESLSKGFAYQLPSLVEAIREKDPEVAARLASDIMTKLRTEKLDSSREARNVAVSLLQAATAIPETDAKNNTKNATPLLDQATVRELTEMVTAEALRSPAQNADMLSSLQSMMPVVEKYAPARVGQIRQKAPVEVVADEDDETEGVEPIEVGKYRKLVEKGSADELLSAAPNAPEGMREMLYQRAASKIMEDGDAERARQIINEKVQDPAQRKRMLAQLDQASAATAAEQGKIEQTRKMLAALRTNEERVMLLTQLASGAAAKGQKKIALQLLEEARGMLGQRAKNINQLGALLMIARTYAQLDPSRSFAILEPIVDQLNELLSAATVLGGFFVEELVRDDEIMLGPLSMFFSMASNVLLQQYIGDINALTRADFDRTKALVDRFQRDEIRTMMRLMLAQSILFPPLPAPSASGVVTTTTRVPITEKDVP
ncbi:MAG TPA: hypothetical protein VGN95_03325 [Pyrinomonadaceae bacterium]|nr:hypothetical protein [Pyrinomonadaceae bacterium]